MTPIATLQYEADEARKNAGLSASVTFQGKCVEYKLTHHRTGNIGGKRGEISDFSDAARLRMIKNLHRIDFSLQNLPLFVTLTYPDELATPDLDTRNVHRKVFARHLEKLLAQHVAASWRIEWVARQSGALVGSPCPHWHLLIFNVGFIPYEEINRLWKLTIGWEGYNRTEIKRTDEKGAIQGYMAKYISKDALPLSLVIAAYQSKVGRSYGWLRKEELPWCRAYQCKTLTESQRQALTSFAAEKLPHVLEHIESSWTLLGELGREAVAEFSKLPLTKL